MSDDTCWVKDVLEHALVADLVALEPYRSIEQPACVLRGMDGVTGNRRRHQQKHPEADHQASGNFQIFQHASPLTVL